MDKVGNDLDTKTYGPSVAAKRLMDGFLFLFAACNHGNEKSPLVDQLSKGFVIVSLFEVLFAFSNNVIGWSAVIDSDVAEANGVSIIVQVVMAGIQFSLHVPGVSIDNFANEEPLSRGF